MVADCTRESGGAGWMSTLIGIHPSGGGSVNLSADAGWLTRLH